MKTDTYTKSILTVIAIALCVLAFQNLNIVIEAQASSVLHEYECTVCDEISNVESEVDDVIRKLNGMEDNLFGNYCSSCPE